MRPLAAATSHGGHSGTVIRMGVHSVPRTPSSLPTQSSSSSKMWRHEGVMDASRSVLPAAPMGGMVAEAVRVAVPPGPPGAGVPAALGGGALPAPSPPPPAPPARHDSRNSADALEPAPHSALPGCVPPSYCSAAYALPLGQPGAGATVTSAYAPRLAAPLRALAQS